MAKGDGMTLEKLYIELGLDMSALQADFLAADRTVTENLGRINRQQNTIKLRVEADIAGLDRVKDSAQILEIQERGLNQQLSLSRDKLAILEAAYKQVANNQNSSAMAVQRAEQAFQKQRIEVARLENQLKSLSAQKISLDTSRLHDTIAKLNAGIQNVRIKAEIDTSRLKDAGNVFDAQKAHVAALTQELELQRQKLVQLRDEMYRSAQNSGANSTTTLNLKTNVLQQLREIQQLETKLKGLQSTNINVQIRADSLKRVEAEISENISRINAKIEHIKVKTDIDVSKLGAAASEFDRAKAHVQGLNRELDLQNQKLAEMRRALGNSISANGLNNVKTINLQTEIQRQIQAIDQLKAKIEELNKIAPPKTNSLLSGYQSLKGNITGKIGELSGALTTLQGATTSADSAITSMLGVIGSIPTPVGLAVAALVGVPLVFKGIENSILDMTRAAAASGDATYVMSRGFQMSVKDAGKFSTNAKVAGAQVNDLAMAVKNVQRQVARGGEDSRASEWLKRYGESAYDASGNLKDLNQMTFALSNALHKAQEDGKGAEFVLNVFRNVSADAITAIEDWSDVNEQASRIVKAGLGNPKLAHELQGNLNALNVQSAQLGTSFTNALLPVANEVVPRLTERMGQMTQIIADNKEVILDFGRDFAKVWGAVEDTVDTVAEGFGELGKLARENRVVRQSDTKSVVEKYKDDATVKNARDIVEREIANGGYTDEDIQRLRARVDLYRKEIERAEQVSKAMWQKRREELAEANKPILDKYLHDDSIETATDLLNKLTDAEKEMIQQTPSAFGSLLERAAALNLELQRLQKESKKSTDAVKEFKSVAEDFSTAGQERRNLSESQLDQFRELRKYYEDAESIRYKLNHNDYQNKLFDVDKWTQEQLPRDAEQSMERYKAVMEARAARIEQIQKEYSERIQQYWRDAADIEYSLTHTAFEKQIRDIELWKDAQRQKAETAEEVAGIIKNAAMKEAEAFEAAMDRIKGKLQSLDDKIFEIDHSQYENDLRRIRQEYLREAKELQDLGIFTPERKAQLDYLYSRQKQNLDAKAAKGGDYTKAPEGAMQRGGNGITVIGADQIIDDGKLNQSIGLVADVSREFAQLSSTLSDETRERIAAIESTKQLADAQNNLAQQTSGLQIIEGDQFVNQPPAQQSPPTIDSNPADSLKNFATSTQEISNAQKAFADSIKDFPPEYFSNLAESAEAVSDMFFALTKSTMGLIGEQDKLATAISNLPSTENATRNIATNQPTDGMLQLATATQDVRHEQTLLAQSARDANENLRAISDISRQAPTVQRDEGWKFGIDYDTFKDVLLTGVGLAVPAAMTGAGAAAVPAIAVGTLAAAIAAAIGKGSYDETHAAHDVTDDRLKPFAEIDMSQLATPLVNIDGNVKSILDALSPTEQAGAKSLSPELFTPLANIDTPLSNLIQQFIDAQSDEGLQELLGTLPNIEAGVADILAAIQLRAEELPDTSTQLPNAQDLQERTSAHLPESAITDYSAPLATIDGHLQSLIQAVQTKEIIVPFETVVAPIDNLATLVGNILTALNNRQPPQINVAPNNNIDLGGAYVFDNALKSELVTDITTKIVDEITSAVQQGISRSNYGFSS